MNYQLSKLLQSLLLAIMSLSLPLLALAQEATPEPVTSEDGTDGEVLIATTPNYDAVIVIAGAVGLGMIATLVHLNIRLPLIVFRALMFYATLTSSQKDDEAVLQWLNKAGYEADRLPSGTWDIRPRNGASSARRW